MPINFVLTLLGYGLAAAGLIGSLYAGYTHIKGIGYQEAQTKYELVLKEYEAKRDAKITSIEKLSSTLVNETRNNNVATTKGIATVLVAAQAKPLVVVNNGECTPSTTFSDSLVAINKQINQSMQGVSK